MKALLAVLAGLVALSGVAAAETIPLPRPRPSPPQFEPRSYAEAATGLTLPAVISSEPTACGKRLAEIAAVELLPRLIGPGTCGGGDMVRLKTATMRSGKSVTINPPPELRCEMAEAVTMWLRDDVAPEMKDLSEVVNFDSYECRPRNRVAGAKMSEHGKGNALDIRAFKLADGKIIDPTDVRAPREIREKLRKLACARFSTVLGPGSDGFHESHIHLDLADRRGGFQMCQWDVRDPPKEMAQVPLPRPRPLSLSEDDDGNDDGKDNDKL